jgi:phosphoribosylaminoimidazole-succinocarboxamide synthase
MPEGLPRPACLYRGSVKDVYGREGVDPYVFLFSDRYSIFDWGEMPDHIPGKGQSLARMADSIFRWLGRSSTWLEWSLPETLPKGFRDSLQSSRAWNQVRQRGVPHHSLGLVNEAGESVPPGFPAHRLAVRAQRRLLPSMEGGRFDYAAYASRPKGVLVPLEVVFRFGAPKGSSFLERVAQNPKYAMECGLYEVPRAEEEFPFPIVEFFTKLEPGDRFLSWEEARSIAGLSAEEQDDLVATTLLIALRLKDFFQPLGLKLWDGKFEFAFASEGPNLSDSQRTFVLVDAVGPDELRLTNEKGIHASKEALRLHYRSSNWFDSLRKAKALAQERGAGDFKRICELELGQNPEPLPKNKLEAVSNLYRVLSDAAVQVAEGRPQDFSAAGQLEEVLEQLR